MYQHLSVWSVLAPLCPCGNHTDPLPKILVNRIGRLDGVALNTQCGPQRVIQIRLLPGAPARIEALRDRHAAVAEGLRDRPNIDARLQQLDRVRVPEVVRTAIYSCLLESLPVEFLEI